MEEVVIFNFEELYLEIILPLVPLKNHAKIHSKTLIGFYPHFGDYFPVGLCD